MLGEWSLLEMYVALANSSWLLSTESQPYASAQGKASSYFYHVAELKWWYIFITVVQ